MITSCTPSISMSVTVFAVFAKGSIYYAVIYSVPLVEIARAT